MDKLQQITDWLKTIDTSNQTVECQGDGDDCPKHQNCGVCRWEYLLKLLKNNGMCVMEKAPRGGWQHISIEHEYSKNQYILAQSRSDARFSIDRKYRYALWRIWDKAKPIIAFIGLNPSTADEIENDPTVRRCVNYAKREGGGGLVMLNIFAYRSTDPKVLKSGEIEPIGELNDYYIKKYSGMCEKIIAAWGTHGAIDNRGGNVIDMFPNSSLLCFGLTKNGQPKHPLYMRADQELKSIDSFT